VIKDIQSFQAFEVDPRSKRNNRKLGIRLMKTMSNDVTLKRQYTNWLDKKELDSIKTNFNVKRDLMLRLEQAERQLQKRDMLIH